MVIELHPELFENIENRQKVTYLLYRFYLDRRYDFFIDLTQIRESPIYTSLSFEDKDLIQEYFNRFVNDSISINYLISNDPEDGSFDLDEARMYFDQPLSIILENSLNDKYFLLAIAEKFIKRGKLIRKHLNFKWIDIVNGGGCENIVNVINEKLSTFINRPRAPETYLRCFVIIDSDSTYPGEIKPTRKKLKDFLDKIGVKYHILLKREMENYLPDETFKEVIGDYNYIKAYLKLDPLQKDYFDIEKGFEKNLASYILGVQKLYTNVSQGEMGNFRNGGIKSKDFKMTFPKLFLSKSVTQENLKQRTAHQGNLANELEIILDKINGLL